MLDNRRRQGRRSSPVRSRALATAFFTVMALAVGAGARVDAQIGLPVFGTTTTTPPTSQESSGMVSA